MQKLIFVIGATATGKTHFIEHNFKEKYECLNVYDYQQRVYDDAGFKDAIPLGMQFGFLMKANLLLLEDIITELNQGKDVVVEQTFYKAKRRIAYIDEIRKKLDANISVYVMNPSNSRWEENIKKRNLHERFEAYKVNAAEIEFPNVSEGFDEIHEVVDGVIKQRIEPLNPEILEKAREELKKENEKNSKADKKKNERRELIESMKTRPFWHYCEICGSKVYITSQEAFDQGWDYPPTVGSFGQLFPRTCGKCALADSLYIKVMKQKIPIVSEETLTSEELKTWKRIKSEPESLLMDEE